MGRVAPVTCTAAASSAPQLLECSEIAFAPDNSLPCFYPVHCFQAAYKLLHAQSIPPTPQIRNRTIVLALPNTLVTIQGPLGEWPVVNCRWPVFSCWFFVFSCR